VDQAGVSVLYVVDPGPDGSMGDLNWVIEARKNGRLGAVIYQGVLATELSKVADVVLPGSAWVEKDATYTNDQNMLQAASRVINPPGEAVDDWQILTSVAVALGLPFSYKSSHDVRVEIAKASAAAPSFAGLTEQNFNRALPLQDWLEASNPMERWKWNTMFQDLPPVKGHNVQMESAPQPAVIPLKLVTEEIARTE
jgi:predicted molibdopterin-dependent oxidoreductase YjgC